MLWHRSSNFTAAAVHRQKRDGVQEGPGSVAKVVGVEVSVMHRRAWTVMTH